MSSPRSRCSLPGLLICCAFAAAPALGDDSTADATAFNESGGERQVFKFNDLGASLGMAAPSDYGGFAVNRNFLRGFANESALRNGYRDFGYLGSEGDVNNEGAEVFKGPASALYGNGKPGGDINLLARRPDGQRRRDLQVGVNRYGYRTLRADLSEGIGAARQVAFRLGVAAEGGHSRREFDDDEAYGLAPALAWHIDPRTRFVLEGDLFRLNDQVPPERLPLAPLIAFSDRRSLGERSDRETLSANTWRLAVEHAFDERWRLRQALFVQRSRSALHATELDVYGLTGPDVLTDDGRAARRVSVRRHEAVHSEVSQTEAYGRFDLFGAQHHVLAGLELGRYRVEQTGALAPLAALDLKTPEYGARPGAFAPDAKQSDTSCTAVLYLQDRMKLNGHWQALIGLRAERVNARTENRLEGGVNRGDSRLISPRVGLVYTPAERISWFASWTQSSRPQLGQATANGGLLPPEEGRQVEVGVQWGSSQQGLLGTLSVYQLTKRNLASTDLANPNFWVASGERRSRGIELDLRGELGPGLSLDAGMEVMRARVVHDNNAPAGAKLPGVAPWFVSVWLTQEFATGWTFGWGVIGEGRRQAAWPPNDLVLPAYVTTDLSLAYRARDWRLQATLGNVLGRRALISDGYAVSIVEPRALTVALSTSF